MATPAGGALLAKAQELCGKARYEKAIECYVELESAHPREGAWPHRAGELWQRLGDRRRAVTALGRAAEKYARAGFLIKAIAVCKLVLRIDPDRHEAAAQVAALNRERGITAPAARPALSAAAAALASGQPMDRASMVGRAAGVAAVVQEIDLDTVELSVDTAGATAGLSDAERDDVRAALLETPFVAVLGEAAMARLIRAARLFELAPGQVLFRQGDAGDTLYLVEEGEVAARTEHPVRCELARLKEGAIFGEMALLTDQPRCATIVATAASRLVAFDRKGVGEVLAAEPRATAVLIQFLRTRLVGNLLSTSPLFTPFAPEERRALARRFRMAEARSGAVLIRQGERARGLHVILAGGAEVAHERKGGSMVALAQLTSGDVFGEISLLEGLAVATVRARSRTLLLILPAADFRELIMSYPHLLAFVSELAEARKAAVPAGTSADAPLGPDHHLAFV